jgi:hypothetical protein
LTSSGGGIDGGLGGFFFFFTIPLSSAAKGFTLCSLSTLDCDFFSLFFTVSGAFLRSLLDGLSPEDC